MIVTYNLTIYAEMVEMGVAEPDRANATSEREYNGSLENEPYLILYNPYFFRRKGRVVLIQLNNMRRW